MKFKSFIALIRLQNILIAELTMLVMIWIIHPVVINFSFWIGVTIVFCVMAGANILNDLYDLKTDMINKPERVLVSGQISIETAIYLTFIFFTAAIIFSFFLSPVPLRIVLASVLLLLYYTSDFKSMPLGGNVVVATITSSLLIFAGLLLGKANEALIPAVLAFFVHLIREITKDYEDVSGDIAAGINTLATGKDKKRGIRYMQLLSLTFIGFLIVVITGFYYGQVFGYLVPILIIVPLLFFILKINSELPGASVFGQFSLFLKYAMFVGLFSMGVGRWFMNL